MSKMSSRFQISTGAQKLDAMLGGGVESCSITEIFGEFRWEKWDIGEIKWKGLDVFCLVVLEIAKFQNLLCSFQPISMGFPRCCRFFPLFVDVFPLRFRLGSGVARRSSATPCR